MGGGGRGYGYPAEVGWYPTPYHPDLPTFRELEVTTSDSYGSDSTTLDSKRIVPPGVERIVLPRVVDVSGDETGVV